MDGSYTGTAGDSMPDAAEAITLAFTIVESEQPLTKCYKLGENGAPQRTGSGAFYAGTARRVDVTGASARTLLAAVAKRIAALGATEAFIAAPPPEGQNEWRVVTKDKANRSEGTVARTKEDFAAPAGRCILMLDCDTKTYPDAIKERLDAQGGLWSVLKSVCPALGEAACFSRPSASSNITVDFTGDTTGPAGEHLYLIATDGRDVHSFAKRLHDRLLLEGWGWFYLTAAGSVRSRSLIDPAASSPDRIVYEANADLSDGLSQAPRDATPLSCGAGDAFLDTSRLPELAHEEEDRLEEIEDRWREENAGKIAAAQAAQVEKRVRDRVASGADEGHARQAVDSAIQAGVLEGEWPIELDTGDTVTVAEILADPAKYHKQTCADPLEPEYGSGRNLAVIYTDGPRPKIYSHAHGGTTYILLDPGRWFQPVAVAERAVEKRRSRGFELVRLRDLEIREPEYLVRGLVETDSVAVVFGDPGAGKSFFALDVAACVASGKAFHGRPVRSGPVVYIAGEGHNGIRRRVSAWEKHTGLDLHDAPFFLSRSAARLLDEDSVESVAEKLREAAAKDGPPALIVFDTLARNFGSGDENNTSDMNKSATDAEYRVEKKDDAVTVTNTKMKDAAPPAPMYFDIETVTLGLASDGEEIASAVLVVNARPKNLPPSRPTDSEVLGLETFAEVRRKNDPADGADVSVHVGDWRAEFYSRHTGDNEQAKRKAFQRVRESLCRKKFLAVEGENYTQGATKWPL